MRSSGSLPYRFLLIGTCLGLAGQSFAADKTARQGWPCWRGPDSSGSADDGVELVDDLGKARFVWQSEDRLPMPYGRGQQGAPIDLKINGGFCDPIIADGKVFFYYTRPAGPVAENYLKGSGDAAAEEYREKFGEETVLEAGKIGHTDAEIPPRNKPAGK